MEILKKCSLATCPMLPTRCSYLLDFNPKFDKLRSQWDRERRLAMAADPEKRVEALDRVDQQFLPLVEPILMKDIGDGIVKCKADIEAPLHEHLSLDQIAGMFGITRPRVQQIEARAKLKISREREALAEFVDDAESAADVE